jgi:predicted transposase/invertase (TIGR01784 family)
MPRYLDPKNDLTFKRIFGEHPDLLISFLNALMPLAPDRKIVSVTYLPAEQVPENPLKKNSIVDVKCQDNFGRKFIVEMQMYWVDSFTNRMLLNASKAYVRGLEKSEPYELLQPVYGLGIINEIFDTKTPEFYHHYQIINRENSDEVIKGLEFVLVELPKFKAEKWADRKMAVLWLRFLQEVKESNPSIAEELLANDDICKAVELCEEGAFTEGEMEVYEQYWDTIRIEKSLKLAGLKDGIVIGKAEGLTEGLKKGKAEGLTEGLEKGKAGVVVASHAAGLPVATIATITGFTPDKVIAILKQEGVLQ